jgi:glycerol-3-phosphate dehydrogenase
MKHSNMFDVVIIGAGVVGCAIARELSRYQLRVTVLEKESDVAEGASKANSAIVHAGYDAKPGSQKALFNVKGSRMFEKWCAELDVPFRRNGSLVVAFSEEEYSVLEELKERGEINGVEELRIVEQEELRFMEPNLSQKATAALSAPSGAICCPYELTFRLAENSARNGVEFQFNSKVESIFKKDLYWYLRTTDGREFKTHIIVNAAGLYADELNNQVSDSKIEITAWRGEYLIIDKQYCRSFNSTIFQAPTPFGKGVLLAPTVDDTIIAGPTADILNDKNDTRTTFEGIEKIVNSVSKVWENFPMSGVIACFSGLRAHEEKGDFVLGEPSDAPGFFNVAGIESPGLTAAPALAEWLSDKIIDKLKVEKRSDFNTDAGHWKRFRNMSMEERAEAVEADPEYGKIVCRCEEVTEAEIRASIRCRAGATTLDGVKRRTRSGMGRCQGGFCTPGIIEILCEELNLKPEQVTKFGAGSGMLFPDEGMPQCGGAVEND